MVIQQLFYDAHFLFPSFQDQRKEKEALPQVRALLKDTPSLANSELSMFIHALLATCHDPRDFYGNNLVKRLKEQVENSQNISHPISYLALCNAHESWPPTKADADLKAVLNSSLEYPFVKDLQAMAVLALSCKANSTEHSLTSTTSRLYKHTSEKLKTSQMQDGSFGNLHTTALITQLDKSKSPLAHRKSSTIGVRFMVEEESAASVGTRPWTPEGRSLTLSIAFML
ncbi:hypothetical protein AVEN_193630-1 [Araneus ventricosus]|uniref:Uncharacterized protein n=1 Tax=Araneus ventricosus TaxID=182803 RepID=A0A4Y2HEV9_ARAVE|nr:hypothetical protein AVEN_193630-1 [Araneus ventricosus]